MEILFLKAFLEEDRGHELQQISSLIRRNLDNFKSETQLKSMQHIVDEKQVGIKDARQTISSLNASQKRLVSKGLNLVKLTLLVPATNAISEISFFAQVQNLPAISKFLFNSCYL